MMNIFVQYSLLVIYLFITPLFGFMVYRRWLRVSVEPLFNILSSIIVGILFSVPSVYLLSWFFGKLKEPIFLSVLIAVIGMMIGIFLLWKSQKPLKIRKPHISLHDVLLIIFTFTFSFWMMQKAFRVDIDGTWLVASNTVFDISHELSVIRSFSFGHNIPFASPFAAGYQEIYHFFFYYFVAIVEQFGVNLPFAFTIASAIGFQLYLLAAYYFSFFLFKRKKLVGWLTLVLLLCNSSLTWLMYMVRQHISPDIISQIWHLAAYPFNGPYDGSTISLFFTLNVFVNQRHLAFGLAIGIWLLTTLFLKENESKRNQFALFLIGSVIGLSILWNIVLSVVVIVSVYFYFIVQKQYRNIGLITIGLLSTTLITCGLYIPDLIKTFLFQIKESTVETAPQVAQFSMNKQFSYWLQNLGIAPVVAVVGFVLAEKKTRKIILFFFVLFIILVVTLLLGKNIFYQKLLNFWYVGFAATVAYGLAYCFNKKRYQIIGVIVGILLVVSGCIDIMVIKNDYAYPAVTRSTNLRIAALHAVLPKNAVVLSYQEMFHDVALAGRKQYVGYFSSPTASIRLLDQQQIFLSKTTEELISSVNKTNITHLYLPKKPRNDFPYQLDLSLYRNAYRTLYEDDESILFAVIQ